MRSSIISIFCFLLAFNLKATKIIVNQDGSGDYITIQAAANIAQAGDTIFIHPGIYLEMVYAVNSGSTQLPIVYLGSTDDQVIIDAENASREFCIRIIGKSNLEFKNIAVRGAYWYGIDFQGPATNVTFDNVEVTENVHPTDDWSYGLVINGALGNVNNVVIRNCEIHHNRAHGLYILNEVHDVLIENCHIHHNGLAVDDVADNIIIADWDNEENGPKRVEIRNCEVDYAMRQGISTWFAKYLWIHDCNFHHNGATAVQIEDGVSNFIVENCTLASNQLHYSTETGIWIDDAKNGVVRNNLIYYNQVGIKVSKSENVIVRHNYVYRNNRPNTQFSENGGIFFLAYDEIDNNNTAVIHNTFFDIGNPAPDFLNAMVLFYEYGNADIENCFIYNNVFSSITNGYYTGTYTSNGSSVDYISDYNVIHDDEDLKAFSQNDEILWNDYLNYSGQESHSLYQYPSFKDSLNNDFRIDESSPCIDNGTFLALTTNYGSGTEVQVNNAKYFNDGYEITTGDTIKVGSNEIAVIEDVNYLTNTITLDRNISWQLNDSVSFRYRGAAPDIGAFEGPGESTGNFEFIKIKEGDLNFYVYPNPFNNVTTIHFNIPYKSEILLELVDITGRLVKRVNMNCDAYKDYQIEWNTINNQFQEIKSGYYLIKLTTAKEIVTEKIVKF
ncbi:right-handed parallel beta-helix repeat-containing protein [Bacteroidota bacterium]